VDDWDQRYRAILSRLIASANVQASPANDMQRMLALARLTAVLTQCVDDLDKLRV
jgi:hypothetical protein